VQQAGDIVVRRDEKRCGIWQRLVVEQRGGIDMSVRRQDRQVADGLIEAPLDGTGSRVGGQEPIRVQGECAGGGHATQSVATATRWQAVATGCHARRSGESTSVHSPDHELAAVESC